ELSWAELVAGGDGQDDGAADTDGEDPAFILATSGTTAKPKLAVHTHGGLGGFQRASASWSASESSVAVTFTSVGMYCGEHMFWQRVPSSESSRIRSSRTAQAASRWGSR